MRGRKGCWYGRWDTECHSCRVGVLDVFRGGGKCLVFWSGKVGVLSFMQGRGAWCFSVEAGGAGCFGRGRWYWASFVQGGVLAVSREVALCCVLAFVSERV